MRLLFAVLASILFFILPALAAGTDSWMPYGNVRYGYWVNLPPGFICGPESDSGDGRSCQSADGANLAVWGGFAGVVNDDGFAGEVKFDRRADADAGLSITYQKTTPHWAVYSGTKGGRIVYTRMIDGCKGQQYATFTLDYLQAQDSEMQPIVKGLAASLKQQTCDETAGAN